MGLLPWRALRWAGALVGWLAGTVLRVRRGHVEAAMRGAGIDRPGAHARAMYRSLAASAFEFLHLATKGDDARRHVHVDAASRRLWETALAHGRGVVIAASHTGNWDLAACAIAREIELLVVTKRLSLRSLDAFWQRTRAARGVRLTEARGAVRVAREVLSRRGAVAMMIDQAPGSARHSIAVPFLGRPALVDRAPAVLAVASGAPLVVAASRRSADGEHQLIVLDVLYPSTPWDRWADEAMAVATRALDGFVRDNPSQWLWLHRRWKLVGAR